ncbi:MAG: hypothetical protein ACUVVU_00260 [Tepidimonas sp.]|uniref:hypothetical protein n=1 Tax=Tepidimonas sp. TaxID=2002775 RepID=UPI004054A81A
MDWFARLPGYRRTPYGAERRVLRALPAVTLVGTALLALPSLLVRMMTEAHADKLIMTTDIWVISVVVLHWTVVLTVGILALIVMVMKGPAYVADAYALPDERARR